MNNPNEKVAAKPPVRTSTIACDWQPHAKRKFKRPDWVPPAQPGGEADGSQPPKKPRHPNAAKGL